MEDIYCTSDCTRFVHFTLYTVHCTLYTHYTVCKDEEGYFTKCKLNVHLVVGHMYTVHGILYTAHVNFKVQLEKGALKDERDTVILMYSVNNI